MHKERFELYARGKRITTPEEYEEVCGGEAYISALIDNGMYPKGSPKEARLWEMQQLLAGKMLEWETERGITEKRINEML